IDNSGGSNGASTDWVLQRSTMTHAVPTSIPATLAGRSVLIGPDLAGNYRFESSPNTTSTSTAHRPGTLDHRRTLSFSAKQLFSGSIGAAAGLSRSTGGSGKTDAIRI